MARRSRIIGLAKLHRKMQRMPAVAKAEIRVALEKSADQIVALARSLAPVLSEYDARRRPGALRDSIGWTWGKAPRGSITLGKAAASNLAGDLTITVFAGNDEAFYARWVEFGTQKAGAIPFFFPAYRALRRSTRSRVRRSITRAAKKVASG